jgi:hypothetical protein
VRGLGAWLEGAAIHRGPVSKAAGLAPEQQGVLCFLDGSKALRKAVQDVIYLHNNSSVGR